MIKTFFLSLIMATSLKVLAESIDTIPQRGETRSEIKIEMYGDYQCPFSKRGNETMNKLLSDIKNDFSITFRHMPMSFHDHARYAHKSSVCALEQSKFWEMHDGLYAMETSKMNPKSIDAIAKKIDLNQDLYKKCMEGQAADKIVERDIQEANKLKISGTPSFIISGPKGTKVLAGAYPIEEFRQAILSVQY